MYITAKMFREHTGCRPRQDDLERCNCSEAGTIGHMSCGWDEKRNMPNFMPGKSNLMEKTPQEKALKTLKKLERQIDGIAETPVRHMLSERLVDMRQIIWMNQTARSKL